MDGWKYIMSDYYVTVPCSEAYWLVLELEDLFYPLYHRKISESPFGSIHWIIWDSSANYVVP
jgi:hypothetical protein